MSENSAEEVTAADIIIVYRRLGSIEKVAQETGLTHRAVRRAVREVSRKMRSFTREEVEYANQLFRDGCPVKEIARTLGRHDTVIRRHISGDSAFERGGGNSLRKLYAMLDGLEWRGQLIKIEGQ